MQQISLVWWILQKVLQIRHGLNHSLLRKERPWKPTRDDTRCSSAQQLQQAGWSTSSQARKWRKSVHLQVLQILHILCFTVVNSETETHFFLVQFVNSPSEYYIWTKSAKFSSFWYGFSNETIGNYAVTCFRKRNNNNKLCSVKYFPCSERTRLYAWFISVQPRARKERNGVGAKNGLRRRELSSPSTRYKTNTRKLF